MKTTEKDPGHKADQNLQDTDDSMSRKEALGKAGKYAAATALTMLVLLSPKQAQATSSPGSPPDW